MNFPLDLRFKLLAISSQIAVRDSSGQLLCYVKQKAFKLKESITVFADEQQKRPLYKIDADRVVDISAQYRITDMAGTELGVVRRRGMRSIWRAQYEVTRGGAPAYLIQEENPWVKVADALFQQIPIVGIAAGYVFHPAYRVTRADNGAVVLRVAKRPAFFEGVFRIEAVAPASEDEQRLMVFSILMMLLLERARG